MTEWLNHLTISTGDHVIVDYKDLKCQSGKMKEKPIYKLDKGQMGCYSRYTGDEKIALGIGVAIFSLIILLLLVISGEFFFNYYLKLDTLPKDDIDENVDNMEYDAFFCYR